MLRRQFVRTSALGAAVSLPFAVFAQAYPSRPVRLQVPFAAVVSFADPSVKFALQFEASSQDGEGQGDAESEDASFEGDDVGEIDHRSRDKTPKSLAGLPRDLNDLPPVALKPNAAKALAKPEEKTAGSGDAAEKSSTVVALDSFRKKQ